MSLNNCEIITTSNDPTHILRQTSQPVHLPLDTKTYKIIGKMFCALKTRPDGVSIAAPQVGHNVRIFVLSPNLYHWATSVYSCPYVPLPNFPLVFINPKMVFASSKKVLLKEGCLSIDNTQGMIARSQETIVRAIGLDGQKFEIQCTGLLSQAFQHEMDHLDGILFTSNAYSIEPGNSVLQKNSEIVLRLCC